MGEGLPFYYWHDGKDLARISKDRLQKPVQQYFHDNLWITTSAFLRDEPVALALAIMGEDRIMCSTIPWRALGGRRLDRGSRSAPGDEGKHHARERWESSRARAVLKTKPFPATPSDA